MIKLESGGVAQLGERTVRIRKVKGSNPSVSTKTSSYDEVFLIVSFRSGSGGVSRTVPN